MRTDGGEIPDADPGTGAFMTIRRPGTGDTCDVLATWTAYGAPGDGTGGWRGWLQGETRSWESGWGGSPLGRELQLVINVVHRSMCCGYEQLRFVLFLGIPGNHAGAVYRFYPLVGRITRPARGIRLLLVWNVLDTSYV